MLFTICMMSDWSFVETLEPKLLKEGYSSIANLGD